MAFDTVESPMIYAENSCIYANGNNQMKVTVQFTALDENSVPIPFTSADLRAYVFLIDYHAPSTSLHLGDKGSNWSAAYSAGTYYNNPPGTARKDAARGRERDAVSSIDFYISTDHYVSEAHVGYIITTETGKIYTCWLGSQSANNIASPAVFSLLQPVVYSMDNCTDTIDGTSAPNLWVHYLRINESASGAYIDQVTFTEGTLVNLSSTNVPWWWFAFPGPGGSNNGQGWTTGYFSMTFPFSKSTGNTYNFVYDTITCPIPYNTDGRSVTSAFYTPKFSGQYVSFDYLATIPKFIIYDQYGNSGNFTIQPGPGGTSDLKYVSLS